MLENGLLLAIAGVFTGVLAGFLGIGGGTVLVPILVTLGNSAVEAVATSSLAIVVTSIAGSIQNWRMGYLNPRKVVMLGAPAIVTAQLGAFAASRISSYILLLAFGLLLLLNIYLVRLRKTLVKQRTLENQADQPLGHPFNQAFAEAGTTQESTSTGDRSQVIGNPALSRLLTGGVAGFLAGLFGIGGGVIMVPMQMLLLGEPIKVAVQTSLGVIVITAISATVGHAIAGNVLFWPGLILGLGGLVGVQFSTRFLPKLPDQWVSRAFRTLLVLLSIYIFWQAWSSYTANS